MVKLPESLPESLPQRTSELPCRNLGRSVCCFVSNCVVLCEFGSRTLGNHGQFRLRSRFCQTSEPLQGAPAVPADTSRADTTIFIEIIRGFQSGSVNDNHSQPRKPHARRSATIISYLAKKASTILLDSISRTQVWHATIISYLAKKASAFAFSFYDIPQPTLYTIPLKMASDIYYAIMTRRVGAPSIIVLKCNTIIH